MVLPQNRSDSKFPPVGWRVTATTVICETTGAEVTVMVYTDGTIKCTGLRSDTPAQPAGKSGRQAGRKMGCTGPECPQNVDYRERLFNEKRG